eukprot:Rmarinus@m.27892
MTGAVDAPFDERFCSGAYNILMVFIIILIIGWFMRLFRYGMNLLTLRAGVSAEQVVRFDGMEGYAAIDVLTRHHLLQLRRRRLRPSTAPVPVISPSVCVQQTSIKYHPVRYLGGSEAQSLVGVEFTLEAIEPGCVQLLWGVRQSALDELVDTYKTIGENAREKRLEDFLKKHKHGSQTPDDDPRRLRDGDHEEPERTAVNPGATAPVSSGVSSGVGRASTVAVRRITKKARSLSAKFMSRSNEDSGKGVAKVQSNGSKPPARDGASALEDSLDSHPIVVTTENCDTPLDLVPQSSYAHCSNVSWFPAGAQTYVSPTQAAAPVGLSVTMPEAAMSPISQPRQHRVASREGQRGMERVAGNSADFSSVYPLVIISYPSFRAGRKDVVVQCTIVEFPGTPPEAVVRKQFLLCDWGWLPLLEVYGLDDPEEADCVVCLSEPKAVTLLPCRHCCVCNSCRSKLDKCPICRNEFTTFLIHTDRSLSDESTVPAKPESEEVADAHVRTEAPAPLCPPSQTLPTSELRNEDENVHSLDGSSDGQGEASLTLSCIRVSKEATLPSSEISCDDGIGASSRTLSLDHADMTVADKSECVSLVPTGGGEADPPSAVAGRAPPVLHVHACPSSPDPHASWDEISDVDEETVL